MTVTVNSSMLPSSAKNMVKALKYTDGEWCYDSSALKNMVTDYFSALYTDDNANSRL